LDEFGGTFRCENLLAPFVGAALSREGDAFPLAFSLMRERSNSAKAPMTETCKTPN
jgi:hypothetical protein